MQLNGITRFVALEEPSPAPGSAATEVEERRSWGTSEIILVMKPRLRWKVFNSNHYPRLLGTWKEPTHLTVLLAFIELLCTQKAPKVIRIDWLQDSFPWA